jgi:hypothetical protein
VEDLYIERRVYVAPDIGSLHKQTLSAEYRYHLLISSESLITSNSLLRDAISRVAGTDMLICNALKFLNRVTMFNYI